MGWSYTDLMLTPAPVVEELTQWVREQHHEQEKDHHREQVRAASLPPRARGRRR